MMTTTISEELQAKIDVMSAFGQGKEIQKQSKNITYQAWQSIRNPVWNFSEFNYRVNPEQPPKKVKMWQWIFKGDIGNVWISVNFYTEHPAACDVHSGCEAIGKAPWTEIEV